MLARTEFAHPVARWRHGARSAESALPGRVGALGTQAAGCGAFEDCPGSTHGADEPIGGFQQIGAILAKNIVIFEALRMRLGKLARQVSFHFLLGRKRTASIACHIYISLRNLRQLQGPRVL